jgi:hypothetical protein
MNSTTLVLVHLFGGKKRRRRRKKKKREKKKRKIAANHFDNSPVHEHPLTGKLFTAFTPLYSSKKKIHARRQRND